MTDTITYVIVLFFLDDYPAEVIQTDLSLEEAQAICSDPESSSRTCTRVAGNERTEEKGAWFIGYREEA